MSLETWAPFSIHGKYITKLHKRIILKQSLVSCLIIYWQWQQGEYLITSEIGFQIENKFMWEELEEERDRDGAGHIISCEEIFNVCQLLIVSGIPPGYRSSVMKRLHSFTCFILRHSWGHWRSSPRKQELGRLSGLKSRLQKERLWLHQVLGRHWPLSTWGPVLVLGAFCDHNHVSIVCVVGEYC